MQYGSKSLPADAALRQGAFSSSSFSLPGLHKPLVLSFTKQSIIGLAVPLHSVLLRLNLLIRVSTKLDDFKYPKNNK